MKSKAALEIANTQGRFMYYYNNGQYDKIVDELFSKDPDVSIKLHDEKFFARGRDKIGEAFVILEQKNNQETVPQKDLHMINTPIIKVSERELTAQATWTTLSFVLKRQEKSTAEPFVTRFDLDYVKEDGRWKILHMEWYIYLSLNPWEVSSVEIGDWIDGDFRDELYVPTYQGNSASQDWWDIIRLQNRFTHARRRKAALRFAKNAEAYFYIPDLMNAPAVGYDQVCQALDALDKLEIQNEKLYLNTFLFTNPVIEVSTDGQSAEGVWLGMNIGIRGPAFGCEPPYPVVANFLYLDQKFVKEDGVWKYQQFDAKVLFRAPVWDFDPASTAGLIAHDRAWHYPPEATGFGTPEDFLEIENNQGFWVNTLKSARPNEFVDRLVAYKDPGVEYHTHDPFMEAHDFELAKKANNVVGAMGIENYRIQARLIEDIKAPQPHHPSCHTTTTPLIEVHEDGEHATAFWFDFGWTLFAEGFNLPPEEWHANPCFARYAQQYAKDHRGQWKIQKFSWYPMFRFKTMWPFKPDNLRGWAGSETNEPWPMPFERYINEDL